MNRRDALTTGAAFAAASVGAACGAKQAVAQDAGHAHHAAAAEQPLTSAAYDCVRAGDACLTHCLALLAKGDASMAGCAAAVREMVAAMNALATISAGGGRRTPEVARALAALCEDCEAECRKHADHHPTCRACQEACQRLVAVAKRPA